MRIPILACITAFCQVVYAGPSRIMDLSGSSTNGGIVLQWTTPALVDGIANTEMDLRYSTVPINALNWSSRDRIAWLTEPVQPQSLQTCLISDLPTNTVYYFAIKIKDENNHWSTMSNLIVTETGNSTYNVGLAWDQSPSTNVVAYRVYAGTSSRSYTEVFDVGNSTSVVVSNREWGVLYYYSATALDEISLESDYSDEISYGRP